MIDSRSKLRSKTTTTQSGNSYQGLPESIITFYWLDSFYVIVMINTELLFFNSLILNNINMMGSRQTTGDFLSINKYMYCVTCILHIDINVVY